MSTADDGKGSRLLDAGYGAALLGLMYGAILGIIRKDWSDLLALPPYSHAMLPAIVLGGLAAMFAIARLVVVRDRSSESGTLLCFAVVVAASPFITVFVLGLAVVVGLVWLGSKLN